MAHITWNSGAGLVPAVLCGVLAGRSAEQFIWHYRQHSYSKFPWVCANAVTELAGTIIYGVLAALYAAATWESAYWVSAAAINPYALSAVVVLSVARVEVSDEWNRQKTIKQFTLAGLMIAIPTLHILSEM